MRDGKLIAACEQERYTLDKHSRKFPVDAINDCLLRGRVSIDEVDEIAFAFQPVYHIQEAYLRPALTDASRIGVLVQDIERIEEALYIEEQIRAETGFAGSIKYYHHHKCHLASTWYPSGFDRALVVSYDGIGEVETGLLALGSGHSLEVFHQENRFPDSLGLFYSAVTHYLGWRHHCDEGIIMGLACYGDSNASVIGETRSYIEVFRDIIRETGDFDYIIDPKWIAYHQVRDKWVSDHFTKVFGPKRSESDEISIHHKNIAAALQRRLEEVVLSQLTKAREKFDTRYLCLSGGVALNCSLNGKIEQSQIFDEIFVQPASGDAGVAVGACYLAQAEREPRLSPSKNHNFYLGSVYEDVDKEDSLLHRGLSPLRPDNLFDLVASRLAEGKIIGWFQGGAEFGPRALGNRSILTRPFPAEMKDYLNARVKFREEFRPFAPAVLVEYFSEYFEIGQESPHMLIACQASEKARQEIPATVHVDNSCRVQTVRQEMNPRFYALLDAFLRKTGCPVLLNTSFNVKGQPIVNTPLQAIDCYLGTNIDCLVLGSYFVEKSELSPS